MKMTIDMVIIVTMIIVVVVQTIRTMRNLRKVGLDDRIIIGVVGIDHALEVQKKRDTADTPHEITVVVMDLLLVLVAGRAIVHQHHLLVVAIVIGMLQPTNHLVRIPPHTLDFRRLLLRDHHPRRRSNVR